MYTCCTALYISVNFARTGATNYVYKPGRSRSALYTRSAIPKMLMLLHQALGSTMAQSESSYTYCKALYISSTFARTGTTSCVLKIERSHDSLYTRTIPKTHTPVHQAMGSTLAQRAFLYTRCKAL